MTQAKSGSRKPRKPSQSKRIREFQAKVRSADFLSGLEAAKAAIAPLIMRKYFIRGLLVGAVVCAVGFTAALWAAVGAGWAVLRLPL